MFGPKDSEELKEKATNLAEQGRPHQVFSAREVMLCAHLLLLFVMAGVLKFMRTDPLDKLYFINIDVVICMFRPTGGTHTS